MSPALSIVVPTLNEAATIASALAALQPLRARGAELIVTDGGSADGTPQLAAALVDRVVHGPRGRGLQLAAGARVARGEVLLFLHADTVLPAGALEAVREAVERGAAWGRFDVEIGGRHPMLPVIAWAMNLRSRWTGIATGDQAIFARRDAYHRSGGFPAIALMEDVALSSRLRRLGRPVCLRARVITSGRRWEARGVFRTIALMWRLRLAYWLGADPASLAGRYV